MAIPLLIDTDPGVDDAFALALAARSPEVDLVGVTTVFGNVPLDITTRNAQRLLAFLGADVPIARGAATPIGTPRHRHAEQVHGDDGLSGQAHVLTEADGLDPRDAVTFLRDAIESTERLTVAAIGPLTNIATLYDTYPDTAAKIGRLVVMGGGLKEGNTTPKAEFNIWSDAEAARRVFAYRPTLVPIDLTRRCAVSGEWLDTLKTTGPLGATLASFTTTYRRHYQEHMGWEGIVVHDAVAVAEAIVPGILTTTEYLLDVDCSETDAHGALIPGENTVDVAVDTDLDNLRAFLMERLG